MIFDSKWWALDHWAEDDPEVGRLHDQAING